MHCQIICTQPYKLSWPSMPGKLPVSLCMTAYQGVIPKWQSATCMLLCQFWTADESCVYNTQHMGHAGSFMFACCHCFLKEERRAQLAKYAPKRPQAQVSCSLPWLPAVNCFAVPCCPCTVVLGWAVLCHAVLCRAVLCHVLPCCAQFCHAMLCCVLPCCAVLRCAALLLILHCTCYSCKDRTLG